MEIVKTLEEYPRTIANLEKTCLELRLQISRLKESLDIIRKNTMLEVANAKDGDKKAFPNAEIREIETETRLANNSEYQKNRTRLEELEKQKTETEILIQQAKDEFSAVRYRLRCESAEKVEAASRQFATGLQIATGLVEILQRLLSKTSPVYTDLESEYTEYTNDEDWPF